MKNALILHGAGNNHTGNWFPWLKRELERESYKVWVPDLPNSEKPDRKSWLATIFGDKKWKFDNESVIVGHSAGATLILRILELLPHGTVINKALLVAGPADMGNMPQYYPYKESLVSGSFQWNKIQRSCKKFYFFCSDNDPYDCGVNQSRIFQKNLGGGLLFRSGEAHFNLEKGSQYKQFAELLEKILG